MFSENVFVKMYVPYLYVMFWISCAWEKVFSFNIMYCQYVLELFG